MIKKMRTSPASILLMVICTFFISIAQLLYKLGSSSLDFSFSGIFLNYPILLGILLYVIGGIMLIIALRQGSVSILYPIIATSFVWVSLLSVFFLNESMNIYRWTGIILIIIGIVFVTRQKKGIPASAYVEVV